MKHRFLFYSLTCLFCTFDDEQLYANNRKSDYNRLVWLNTQHTISFNKQSALTAEYQWRRTNGWKDWQQSLFRAGFQYTLPYNIKTTLGYAWIETYPYGDYASAVNQPFPEHRIFQQVTWDDQKGRLLLNHRGRLEQRFLGVLNPLATGERRVTKWSYMNRVRYQIKATVPINNKMLTGNTLYATAYDEIFIGFGKNVNSNVFDQNRIGLALGYKFKNKISIEAGWFNQTLQQARPVDNQAVYQYNQGILLSLMANWN